MNSANGQKVNKQFFKQVVFWVLLIAALFVADRTFCDQANGVNGVWVMPSEYAHTVNMFAAGDNAHFGNINKWNKIYLWGRCPAGYRTAGFSYQWKYGDGNSSVWHNITNANYHCLNAPVHQYANNGYDFQFYDAALKIKRNSDGVIISTTSLQVTVVNFDAFDKFTVGSDAWKSVENSKRLIIEAITKGNGFKWLYLNQESDGRWKENIIDGATVMELPVADTSMGLVAFLVNGHSVFQPNNKANQIFSESISSAVNYLMSRAYWHLPGPISDINSNGRMISFSSENIVTNDSQYLLYEHGMAMQTLGVLKSSLIPDTTFQIKNYPGGSLSIMKLQNIVKDTVDFAAYYQGTGVPPEETGWRYQRVTGPRTDLSVTQWIVVGLASIEGNWGIAYRAVPIVRSRLLNLVRMYQWQNHAVVYGVDPAGSAAYRAYHNNTILFSDPVTCNSDISYWQDFNRQRVLVGTNSIMQVMYYLSLDTTTVASCQCGSAACQDVKTDFRLNSNNFSLSCLRLRWAVNYIAQAWPNSMPFLDLWDTSGSNVGLYDMYSMMKALRLVDLVKARINNGKVGTHQWEDEFSDYLLKNPCYVNHTTAGSEPEDGWHWHDNWGGPNPGAGDIATAWALCILSESVYTPTTIKTEIPGIDVFKKWNL